MSTKKELLRQIEELQKKVDAIPDDDGVWIPKEDDQYWFIDNVGRIRHNEWVDDDTDQYRLASGNIYRTEEQAEIARDRRLAEVRVFRRIAELNAEQGWAACFSSKQDNFCIGIRKTGELAWHFHIHYRVLSIEYYGSQETIETVMTEMEDDYLLMLGGSY